MNDGPRWLESRPHLSDYRLAVKISIIFWAVGLLLFVVMAVPTLRDAVQVVDDAVHQLAVDLEQDVLVAIAEVLDFVGSTVVTAPIIVGVALWLGWKRRWEDFSAWAVAMVVSQMFIGPIKNIYERPRPPLSLVETTSWSFPSGHALAGAAISVALVIVLLPAGRKRRAWEIGAAMFAFAMALSRVYLRAHWLTDAVAGAALGTAIAIGSAALIHWWDERRPNGTADQSSASGKTG